MSFIEASGLVRGSAAAQHQQNHRPGQQQLSQPTWALIQQQASRAAQSSTQQPVVAGQPSLPFTTPFKKISRPAGPAPQRASARGAGQRQKKGKMTGGPDFETDSLDESDSSATSGIHGRSSGGGNVNPKLQRWSKFVRNLYEMTASPENEGAIGFSEDGTCLEVRDPKLLSSEVLHRYFKHSNVSSFIRQLNNYGFRTIPMVMNRTVAHCFAHECFQRDRLDLLCMVRRRVPGMDAATAAAPENHTKNGGGHGAVLSPRDAEMEARLAQLTQMNDQLKRQNFELHEENKRLRASWRFNQDPQQQQQHLSHHRAAAHPQQPPHHGQLFPDVQGQQQHQQQQHHHHLMSAQQQQQQSIAMRGSVQGQSGDAGDAFASYQARGRSYSGTPGYNVMDNFGQNQHNQQGFLIDSNPAGNELFGMPGSVHLPPGPFWSDE